jgi:hypothetical protein
MWQRLANDTLYVVLVSLFLGHNPAHGTALNTGDVYSGFGKDFRRVGLCVGNALGLVRSQGAADEV